MDHLQHAKINFKLKLSGEMGYIDVPGWSDPESTELMRIYFKKAVTMKAQEKWMIFYNKGLLMRAGVERLIQCAVDCDGKAMFRPSNVTELMTMVDSNVVSDIVEAMAEYDDEMEEIEKK